jgi:glycine/serine hydroxymethyltransferase
VVGKLAQRGAAHDKYAEGDPGYLYDGSSDHGDVIEQLPVDRRRKALTGCRNCSPTAITTTRQQKGHRP